MSSSHFIVATAGHVDHGKSALVKALTGIDPDRLPEEKARGITIDLGFAHLELPVPDGGFLKLGLVDVPGHEDFVKNMVAGVGSIDLALFVVAADDGWMPQTEEHLQILSYLGVKHAVVALTKIDLAEDREEIVVASLREQLRDTTFANAPIVPTSVVTGQGLDNLKSALCSTLSGVASPQDLGKPRLAIDRVFVLRGIGTVVTGTLAGGTLLRNQSVILQPSGKVARIRSLQSHGHDVELALPGTRTALNLPDVPVATGGTIGAARGQVVTIPELGGPVLTMDVLFERSPRPLQSKSGAARQLKDGALVRVHHGSANVAARLCLAGGTPIGPGEGRLAQLRLEQPLFVLSGDGFIVRDWPEQHTLGGGVILDTDGDGKRFRSAEQKRLLTERRQARGDVRIWAATELERDRVLRQDTFLSRTRFGAGQARVAIQESVASERAMILGGWIADAACWKELRDTASEAVRAEHRTHPERLGLALNELRSGIGSRLPDPAIFDLLIEDMCRNGFSQTGTIIREQSHHPALPPKLQAAGTTIRAALSAKPMEPPPRKELAPNALAQQALRFLIETGEAVEIDAELVILAEHLAKARETVRTVLQSKGPATASALRQALGTSRRVIIPLLERLDREGVTMRQGEVRVLRS
jgi:selenocysteine-specific elongation factor